MEVSAVSSPSHINPGQDVSRLSSNCLRLKQVAKAKPTANAHRGSVPSR
jgi:hypothetical protein